MNELIAPWEVIWLQSLYTLTVERIAAVMDNPLHRGLIATNVMRNCTDTSRRIFIEVLENFLFKLHSAYIP